jgi:hypothetical protein
VQVHGALEVAQTRCTTALNRHEAPKRSESPMLTSDSQGGRGRLGEADGELTG